MIKTQTNVYDSSTVESSTYIYETKELFVSFKFGVYKYIDVEVADYLTFANDKSQGVALNSVIKGTYKYEKLEDGEE
jgi:hypothetical protein|tara:strand:- start:1180 stop:1410 length:231 start_codon:yes stop_codon:yes gene_type:complete